jgi:ABC-type phosphate transport system permease subunit
MVFDISIAITWLLFLALFPMAFFWLRRAYRIFVKKDYSEVALKRGEAPADPKKWAPATGIVNLAAGGTALVTIIGVLLALFPYKTWSAMAGVTLWFKVFADYIVSRQAHPFELGRKKNEKKKAD